MEPLPHETHYQKGEIMKESIVALTITIFLGLGVIAATGYMQRLDNLEREVTALEMEIEYRQRMLNDMTHLLSWAQSRALEMETLFSASELLEFLAHDLAAAGATVVVNR